MCRCSAPEHRPAARPIAPRVRGAPRTRPRGRQLFDGGRKKLASAGDQTVLMHALDSWHCRRARPREAQAQVVSAARRACGSTVTGGARGTLRSRPPPPHRRPRPRLRRAQAQLSTEAGGALVVGRRSTGRAPRSRGRARCEALSEAWGVNFLLLPPDASHDAVVLPALQGGSWRPPPPRAPAPAAVAVAGGGLPRPQRRDVPRGVRHPRPPPRHCGWPREGRQVGRRRRRSQLPEQPALLPGRRAVRRPLPLPRPPPSSPTPSAPPSSRTRRPRRLPPPPPPPWPPPPPPPPRSTTTRGRRRLTRRRRRRRRWSARMTWRRRWRRCARCTACSCSMA